MGCCFSHSAHWLPTRKKLLYTVANPARGLLNSEGPGYSRVEGEDLVSIKSVIVKRQLDFLRQEFLPIPHVRKRSDKNPLHTVLDPTERLPVRYITVKLHKNPVATRGITACCGSPLDGIARIVNACLVALRPVLHALWREKCL